MTAAELRGGYLFVAGTPTSLWETSYVGAGPGSVLRSGLCQDFVPTFRTVGTQQDHHSPVSPAIKLKTPRTSRSVLSFVAGTGLEPATFGL